MENKSTWDDISKVWKRIAAVLAAAGVISTFIIQMFHTPPELTYSVFASLGVVLLIISFYVDRQTSYTHAEILRYEQKARDDFKELMNKAKEQTLLMKDDSNAKIESLTASMNKVLKISEETRMDTLRIQLLMIMERKPDNIDTILKLAETYFVHLHGDWYMTSEFSKWAKKHDIDIPPSIYTAMEENHK